jgi:hypothetical protein
VVGVVAASIGGGGVAAAGVAAPALGRSPAGRCAPQGRVLAHSSGVVVWRVALHGQRWLYSCVPASGATHRVVHADATTMQVVAAGHYVAFAYEAKRGTVLDVFDALTGHTELQTPIGYPTVDPQSIGGGGSVDNEQPGCIDPWTLAPSGLVALIEDCAAEGAAGKLGLTVTNGTLRVIDLDTGSFGGSQVRFVGGSTLTWSFDGSPRYTAPLGPQLNALLAGTVPPPTPLPTVCGLLSTPDAQVALGPVTQAAGSDSCTYTTAGAPKSTLTVTLQPSLTEAQVTAAKQAAYGDESAAGAKHGAPDYDKYTWSAEWEKASGGMGYSDAVRFAGNVEFAVEMVTADPGNSLELQVGHEVEVGIDVIHPYTATVVAHLADIGFDRLMGWPVQ